MSINEPNEGAFDKRTLIAIVLMVVTVTVGMTVQSIFFPKQPLPVEPPASAVTTAPAQEAELAPAIPGVDLVVVDDGGPLARQEYVISTDLFEARFTNEGGELVSLLLKDHLDKGRPVDMFLANDSGLDGFSLAFGGPGSAPLTALMNASQPAPGVIEFSRVFMAKGASGADVPFTLKKRFEFKDGDYMFRLSVTVENSLPAAPGLGDGAYAYTLAIGPQIGPAFVHLSRGSDFRKIVTLENDKRKVVSPKGGRATYLNDVSWAAIAGKYFTLMALPDATPYAFTYTSTATGGVPVTTAMAISRPVLSASAQTDVFHFYAGPKSSRDLSRYDDPLKNGFKRVNDRLEDVMEGGNMLGWLESLLKWTMNFFYSLVHNYGVAIILLTVLVRAIMFPLTFKGSMSTARMQELQPKMKEIQDKFKANPQKMNQELAEFYKREGYNPLSGCLPMLIQLPIFFAMYALFNNHFDLRGASFIPGWISDLSLPESVYDFATVNLVIWKVSAIRILPVIYVASQLLYGKFMQNVQTGGQSAGQMKFMMYGMPIIFFFVLYDMPSGLLVYWIAANILTIVQQIVINKYIHKRKLAAAAAAPQLKIVPHKGKKGVKGGRN